MDAPDHSLLSRTYRLLDTSQQSYREVAQGTGLDIDWLKKFGTRRIREPGVLKTQRLYDYLLRAQSADDFSPRQSGSRRPARKTRGRHAA
jgi:hypothetical protein